MRQRLIALVAPAFLLLCLLLGGSTQGVWRVMILQLLAVGLIAWSALLPRRGGANPPSRWLLLLTILSLLLFVVQLVPLPSGLWSALPGREIVAQGYRSLGYPLPWLPLSMTPYATLATSLTLLVPVAMLLWLLRSRAEDERWLAGALIAGTLLGVLLGAMQSVGGTGAQAWWYLYDFTNTGAVGFFSAQSSGDECPK